MATMPATLASHSLTCEHDLQRCLPPQNPVARPSKTLEAWIHSLRQRSGTLSAQSVASALGKLCMVLSQPGTTCPLVLWSVLVDEVVAPCMAEPGPPCSHGHAAALCTRPSTGSPVATPTASSDPNLSR
eukprot:5326488-Amphidinium_carterae.1